MNDSHILRDRISLREQNMANSTLFLILFIHIHCYNVVQVLFLYTTVHRYQHIQWNAQYKLIGTSKNFTANYMTVSIQNKVYLQAALTTSLGLTLVVAEHLFISYVKR